MKELNVGTATELVRRWRERADTYGRLSLSEPRSKECRSRDLGKALAHRNDADELEALYLPKEDRQ